MPLPPDYASFLKLSPEELQTLTDELLARPLSPQTVEAWLRDWAVLGTLFQESLARLDIATSVNTADTEAAEKLKSYRRTIWPIGEKLGVGMEARLFEHEAILPPALHSRIARMKRDRVLNQSDELIALVNQDYELMNQYAALLGAQTISWQGQTLTDRQARGLLSSADRETREGVWRMLMARRRQDSDAITQIWRRMLDGRQALALKNGFQDYVAYRWREMERDDYTPGDSQALHRAFLDHWSPLFGHVMARQRDALGLQTILPWDIQAPVFGEPLKPFTDAADLIAKVGRVFQRLDPQFGAEYERAVALGLLDIAMRGNTAPVGGFARAIGRSGVFVMLNVSGTRVDVENLIHEMGHAFSLVGSCQQPSHLLWGFPQDFGETPSSVMEMLSMPFWDEFYQGAALAQAKQEYFAEMLLRNLEEVILEAFQLWAYTHLEAAHDPAQCNAKWLELQQTYLPGVDWLAVRDDIAMGWQRSSVPFYAPLFAMEYVYGRFAGLNLLKMEDAVSRYKNAISLGSSVGTKDLFAALGTHFFLTAEDVTAAAEQVETRLTS